MLKVKSLKRNSKPISNLVTETCVDGLIPRFDPEVSANGLGCYALKKDANDTLNGLSSLSGSGLNFSDPYVANNLMDPGYCIKYCSDYFFKYAALRKGTDCRCGQENSLQNYTLVAEETCKFNCTFPTLKGNVTYKCGGDETYTIYEAKPRNIISPNSLSVDEKLNLIRNLNGDKRYQGCIQDSQICGQRVLNGAWDEKSGMTIDRCIDFCAQQNKGFKYAGLETGTQCFCASDYDKIRLADLERCSTTCPGNIYQICGGPWTLSVYDISGIPDPTPTVTSTVTETVSSSVNPALIPGLAVGTGVGGFGSLALIVIVIIRLVFRTIFNRIWNL